MIVEERKKERKRNLSLCITHKIAAKIYIFSTSGKRQRNVVCDNAEISWRRGGGRMATATATGTTTMTATAAAADAFCTDCTSYSRT